VVAVDGDIDESTATARVDGELLFDCEQSHRTSERSKVNDKTACDTKHETTKSRTDIGGALFRRHEPRRRAAVMASTPMIQRVASEQEHSVSDDDDNND
jgi:hypothetical protein